MKLPQANIANYTMRLKTTGKEISFRPYTVKEEKVLLIALESKDIDQIINAIYNVVDSCTFNQFDSRALATFELEELFINIRSKSVGEVINLQIKCSECDELNKSTMNLLEYMINEPTTDNKINIGQGIGFVLKYPSFGVAKLVMDEGSNAEKIIKMCAMCIDYIYDENEVYPASEASEEDLLQFVESLTTDQFREVKEFLDTSPKLQNTIKFTCTGCGHMNQEVVEGLQNFFT